MSKKKQQSIASFLSKKRRLEEAVEEERPAEVDEADAEVEQLGAAEEQIQEKEVACNRMDIGNFVNIGAELDRKDRYEFLKHSWQPSESFSFPVGNFLLQQVEVDLVKCCSLIQEVKAVLTEYKTVDSHWDDLYKDATTVAAAVDCTVMTPRWFHSTLSPSEYFKSKHYIPFLETIIEQLDYRFSNHQMKIFSLQALIPKYFDSVPYNQLEEALSTYERFLDGSFAEFKAEFERWKAHWKNVEELPGTVLASLDACDQQFFPMISTVLMIFCTLPVTTASVERSFSAMRRIKTYLRSSMGEERFTGLSLMSIHRNIVIPPEEIGQRFANIKERRLQFFLKE